MSTVFCPECNNLLYPREDRVEKRLLVACRSCDYEVEAPAYKVYSRNINLFQENDPILATVDLSSDPTYPKILNQCPKCKNNEAVFFQSKSKQKDANMKVFF
jgi:DNA-directed RNA polymerase II subunit RPB9